MSTSGETRLTRRRVLGLGLGLGGLAAVLLAGDSARIITQDAPAESDAEGLGPFVGEPRPVPPVASTAAKPSRVDPGAVAAANAGRVPTEWGTNVSGVHTQLVDVGTPGAPTLALTFDACGGSGGSGVDDALLAVLEREDVPATLFLNQRWINANRDLARRLAASPRFELGNHGSRHLPLSVTGRRAYGIRGTTDAADAVAEVWANHELLTDLVGHPPRWFRSGTAHYDEVATAIAMQLGEQPVGFTTNGDAGATASAAKVTTAVLGAPPGGIVLAHMNRPKGRTAAGMAAALPQLRAAGVRFVTLSGGGGTRA